MKKIIYLLSLSLLLGNFATVSAQESAEGLPENYKERHPVYDYSEKELNNTDSIPDFASKPNQLKISGTVFMNDGVTPAENVILFITQADEDGDYKLKTRSKKRYVHHRAWVKTDANGAYTFYTFIPGADRYSKALKMIHLVIKEPNRAEYSGDDFIFDDDPSLTKSCRKRLEKNGIDNILKPEKKESLLVATKNITLEEHSIVYAKK